MNRILFRAVLAFTLGEVIFVLTIGIPKAGIAITMSAFCVLIFCYYKKKKCVGQGIVAVLCMLVGLCNMRFDSYKPSIDNCVILRENSEIENSKTENSKTENRTDGTVTMEEVAVCGTSTRGEITVYGTVERIRNTAKSREMLIKVINTFCNGHIHKDSYSIIWFDMDNSCRVGDYIKLRGILTHIKNSTNPGSFDKEEYYESKNVRYQMNVSDSSICGSYRDKNIVVDDESYRVSFPHRISLFIKSEMDLVSKIFDSKISRICEGTTRAIYKGLLLGNKSEIDDEIKQLYKISGISHILAISSLHITLIGGMLLWIMKKLGIGVYLSGALSLVFIFLYGVMTGFGIASIRAIIMMLLMLVANILGRDYDLLTSLSVAFLVSNLAEPSRLMEGAGIMSFSAILGVAVGNYVIKNLLKNKNIKQYKKKHKIKWSVISALIYQTSIQLVMLPVTVSIYYEIYPYSFFVNLVVVPLMSVVVMSGFLSLIVSFFNFAFPAKYVFMLCRIILLPGEKLLAVFEKICRVVVRLPYCSINVGHINLVEIIVYYAFVAAFLVLFDKKISRRVREIIYKKKGIMLSKVQWIKVMVITESLIIAGMFCSSVLLHKALHRETMVFLDVGQGACSVIRTEDRKYLVFDGGSTTKVKVGEYEILPVIKYLGGANVDYWFISHADTDHISGLLELLENYELTGLDIKNLVVYKASIREENLNKLLKYASDKSINVLYVTEGSSIKSKDFTLSCVHPEEKFETQDVNEMSLALTYKSKKHSVLFTGDMGQEAIKCMMKDNGGKKLLENRYEYMQIPHHGSRNSLSKELYKLCEGGTAIISCGIDNSYGHPHKEVLEALSEEKIKLWRIDLQGALIIK